MLQIYDSSGSSRLPLLLLTQTGSVSVVMNIFSYLPTSFSLRAPTHQFEPATPLSVASTSETLLKITQQNSAFKNVPLLPLEFTDLISKNHQTQTKTPDEFRAFENHTDSISSPAFERSTSLKFSPIISHATHDQSNSLLRKYSFLHHHQCAQQRQSNLKCYIHPESPDQIPSRDGNGLASLKALCDTDVSVLLSRRPIISMTNKKEGISEHQNISLKFGMERILSEDFGKCKQEKENTTTLRCMEEPSPKQASNPSTSCHSALGHLHRHRDVLPYGSPSYLPSLSAVQALHAPRYQLNTSSIDSLPGPYSVLSTDAYSSSQTKRKRSWSRAVFSNLQRKGLEKRFEVQKYVTKLDRRQLANVLGLTDAQVKVWFQNRRMKWRHAQQQRVKEKEEKDDDDDKGVDVMNGTDNNEDDIDVIQDQINVSTESSELSHQTSFDVE